MEFNFAVLGGKVVKKNLMEESIQYLAPNQDSIFGLSKLTDIAEPVMNGVPDNVCSHVSEGTDLDSHSCDKLDIDQIRSICATSSPY